MTPSPDTILTATALTKVFRDFWRRPKVRAVDDLHLVLHPGEVLGLLGPNGSGKSTTIKMILGLLRPTHGRIQVFGQSPESPSVRARIGYLPELSHLYQYLTPRETLEFYGGLFDLPRRVCRERTEQLLAMVDLSEVANRPVGEFSKGMARRVGLAQALLNDPDIVILDEPTSGLDPIGRHAVKGIIRTLAKAGKTVLLSSHLLGEIEDVCDRVAILYRGKLQAEGRLDGLLARNEHVRLTLDNVPASELEALCALIASRTGAPPTVDHPSMTLEEYFLEVVAKADGEHGVLTPPTIASFLETPSATKGGSA
jgi:ABC-2 type transport system ATP-binding protein